MCKDSNKPKLGMYGQTPRILLGGISICEFILPPNEKVWLEDESDNGGEGGEFPKESLASVLREYFDKNF